jgi:predicted XRE-type DNA-binding protein
MRAANFFRERLSSRLRRYALGSYLRIACVREAITQGPKARRGIGPRSIQGFDAGEGKTMSNKLKRTHGTGNVFADLGFNPEESDNLLLRAQLMSRIRDEARGLTQREAAAVFNVSQPRLNDVLRGKIDKFSLDALVNMLGHAGMRVELKVKKAA